MFNIGENYEMLWKAIIRPPKAIYNKEEVGIISINSQGPNCFEKMG